MFDVIKKSIEWGEETLTLETGKVARQADGTVIATLGETSVMANVTFANEMREGQDFFPLTVHYQEKYYAAGKIPGGFFKREARPSEAETLTARLIDRPIRPLFVEGFKHEVLVMCTVLSHDLVNSPDVVALIAASSALTLSGVPFMGPIAATRVGFENGDYEKCGAKIAPKASDVFNDSDMIIKVKEPQTEEVNMLRENQILFTYLHLLSLIHI